MQKTIIIGDVHGCFEELQQLLEACDYKTGDDVVFVGDIIGRGPSSKAVLQWIEKTGSRSVLGNHEQALIEWRLAIGQRLALPSLNQMQRNLIMELDSTDWSTLHRLPLMIRLPFYNVVVVHAGFVPGVPLENQDPQLMLNIRTIRADGTGSQMKSDGPLWGILWQGPEEVVFGHHASQGLQCHPYATGIDTGCVYGGSLTAYLLPERRFVSIRSTRVYYPL